MIQNIVLIGAGKLATQLGSNLVKRGFNIRQVYSRTLSNAELLANKLDAYFTDKLSDIQQDADLYIVSVADSVLKDVALRMPQMNGIVVHTAGSLGLDLLQRFDKHGIFYPFQTFSKDREVDFSTIPILLEGNCKAVTDELNSIAGQLSSTVMLCDSNQRQQIHLAAVFACNFSNHLYAIAEEILLQNNIDFDVIKPLIKETANKLDLLSPKQAQTGPAIRGDANVINKHLKMLENNLELHALYQTMSKRIMDFDQR
jgi:predicted short-subunit dehydrogenase-like oxidoreductase (DUF2520 family)